MDLEDCGDMVDHTFVDDLGVCELMVRFKLESRLFAIDVLDTLAE